MTYHALFLFTPLDKKLFRQLWLMYVAEAEIKDEEISESQGGGLVTVSASSIFHLLHVSKGGLFLPPPRHSLSKVINAY